MIYSAKVPDWEVKEVFNAALGRSRGVVTGSGCAWPVARTPFAQQRWRGDVRLPAAFCRVFATSASDAEAFAWDAKGFASDAKAFERHAKGLAWDAEAFEKDADGFARLFLGKGGVAVAFLCYWIGILAAAC